MVKVLICEDELKELAFLEKTISDYILMENLDMEIAVTSDDPDELIDYIKENKQDYLCFLDIELNGKYDGVRLASKIRKLAPDAHIVFVTGYPQYMQLTFEYKVGAVGYLIKGDIKEQAVKIVAYVDYADEYFNNPKSSKVKKFIFKDGDKIVTEAYDDIMSFELATKNKKKVTMYAKNRNYEFLGTLNEIEGLDDRLFRCDRSVLVNVSNIKWVDPKLKKIHMINGDTCTGSARGISELVARMTKDNE